MKKATIFVAMPIAEKFDDVMDAIETLANQLGMNAIRIDRQQSNEKISDRIIKEIQKADFIVADLTSERPNVFFEAGFALGGGKIPIFIAAKGTGLQFDIHDYPVIFFGSMVELKRELKKRLIAIKQGKAASSLEATKNEPVRSAPVARIRDSMMDKQQILTEWFNSRLLPGFVRYTDLDHKLGFKAGDTKKLIDDAIQLSDHLKLESKSHNVARYTYKRNPLGHL